jgi:hypothetical protein
MRTIILLFVALIPGFIPTGGYAGEPTSIEDGVCLDEGRSVMGYARLQGEMPEQTLPKMIRTYHDQINGLDRMQKRLRSGEVPNEIAPDFLWHIAKEPLCIARTAQYITNLEIQIAARALDRGQICSDEPNTKLGDMPVNQSKIPLMLTPEKPARVE